MEKGMLELQDKILEAVSKGWKMEGSFDRGYHFISPLGYLFIGEILYDDCFIDSDHAREQDEARELYSFVLGYNSFGGNLECLLKNEQLLKTNTSS